MHSDVKRFGLGGRFAVPQTEMPHDGTLLFRVQGFGKWPVDNRHVLIPEVDYGDGQF